MKYVSILFASLPIYSTTSKGCVGNVFTCGIWLSERGAHASKGLRYAIESMYLVRTLVWGCKHAMTQCGLDLTFLCQLTCQSADIMSSLCGVGVRVRVRVNNFSSKTTRPRDVLFFFKDTLSIEDEKLFKACKSVCSSVC